MENGDDKKSGPKQQPQEPAWWGDITMLDKVRCHHGEREERRSRWVEESADSIVNCKEVKRDCGPSKGI